ncbi:MAG: penicillin-binding protein 2 [Myxococcales bacterium]|nr:penicillin-binding protein 2 [Myxococcales bacterium]MCB9524875.1 penicillin-binding protein 2 [Myxococcales bacterium]
MADVFLGASASGYQMRVRRLTVAVLVAFGVLLGRLAQLQLVEGDELQEAAVRNFVRTVRLPADRGSIKDRHGRLLAVNRPSFDLYVTPARVEDLDALLVGLREVLELDELDLVRLREKVEQPRGMWRHRAFRVAQDIDRQRVALAEALRTRVGGVSIQVRYQREYPAGEIGAHLVGYLGKPRAEELKDEDARYSAESMIGRFGLERAWEGVLAGQDGSERYAVNARGARQRGGWAERAMSETVTRQSPERGHDLVLTVDMDVQKILYKALAQYESGAAVVVDPRDGSVLGIVSKPSFDPNAWSGRLTKAEYKAVADDPYLPMLDKSVHSYFPGSIYKPITALAALEEGMLNAEEPIESPGSYEYGNRIFHCHKRSGHGAVDLNGAMAASADVYFYKLGEAMGIDTLAVYARKFGLGQPSGLGINGDAPGIVPTKAYHDENTRGGFQHGLALSTAIGQGDVRTSPVQMAMVYAALANGGKVFKPRVVQRVEDEEHRVIDRFEPEVRSTLDAKPEHLAAVSKSLERAVNDEERATGHLAGVDYGLIAGKTGTAQVRKIVRGHLRQNVKRFRDRDHAWFAAFAPYEAPKVVVVVFLEHGGSGGKEAAPVARRIIEDYHQQIEPIFSTSAANTVRRRR